MNNDKFKNYLYDLGTLIKEKAKENKHDKEILSDKDDINYKLGCLMTFYEIIDIMKQQAEAFNIEPKDIGLDDINPELELL